MIDLVLRDASLLSMRSIILISCLILSLSKDEEARSAVSKDEARYVEWFFSGLLGLLRRRVS